MWVKICANTNLADARLAAELGADAVGFVFAPSKRRVTPEQVAEITRELPAGVLTVGVFSSVDSDEILRAAGVAGLHGLQVHSEYDPRMIHALHEGSDGDLAIFQVVSIEAGTESWGPDADAVLLRRLQEPFSNPRLRGVLLDAAHAGASGGLGRAFAWEHVVPVLQRALERASASHDEAGTAMPRLLLAGGLRPENVVEAVRTLHPDGVDVASGVEAVPGRKDPARVSAFISAARAAGHTAG